MGEEGKKITFFLLSFFMVVGSYLVFIMWSWLLQFIMPLFYIPVCLVAFFAIRGTNQWFARGFLWGLIAIFIFLFTLGGCGIMNTGI